jgi:hypothetical protein
MALEERLRGLHLESQGRVKIVGLVARAELNNSYGIACKIDDAKMAALLPSSPAMW